MELFERIKMLRDKLGDYKKIYEPMELRQQKFQSYLNVTSQKNLWEHLPKLTDAYPEISKPWLYWGEGPMFTDAESLAIHAQKTAVAQHEVLAEANRKLVETNQMLVEALLKR